MNLLRREEGASILEFAVSCSVLIMVALGIIQVSMALYAFDYVSDAAKISARYAVVRGPNSCTIAPTFPNCNLNPSNITSTTDPTKNPLLASLESTGYPGLNANNLSLTATWLVTSQDANGATTWPTPCPHPTTNLDAYGNVCNALGNAVQVTVTYNFPLDIPFWTNAVIPITGTSQMVISE